jgi:hypothetical protein
MADRAAVDHPPPGSDPAVGACHLDCLVAVSGTELGHGRGQVVADRAWRQGCALRDFLDGGPAICSDLLRGRRTLTEALVHWK